MNDLVRSLTNAQRDAVKTVRITATAAIGLYYYQCSGFADLPPGLEILRGLERVVIDRWHRFAGATADRIAKACEATRKSVGDRHVDTELDFAEDGIGLKTR